MPSNSNYQTALEGILLTQITAAATTATVKVKEINGATPTWLTTAHRLTIIQKSRTVTKVEVVDVAAGTTQSGSTVTLGTMTRGLPLDGTGFTGTGTAQTFTSGAKVIVTWDAQAGRQTAFKDIANTFTTHQTISSTNELRFADSATAIWDDGTDLKLKSSAQAAVTLSTLASASGVNDKVKITATDTTEQYLNDALLVTAPITKATNSGGANETMTLALDTVPVASGGTARTSHTAYAVICGGTTSTGAQQSIASVGTDGQILTSNGAGALPTFQSPADDTLVSSIGQSANVDGGSYTTAETYQFGANYFSAGDVIEVWFTFTSNGGTRSMQVTLGGTQLFEFTDVGTSGVCHGFITVRTIGSSGTCVPSALLLSSTGTASSATASTTTINTTGALDLDVDGKQTVGSETEHFVQQFLVKVHHPSSTT